MAEPSWLIYARQVSDERDALPLSPAGAKVMERLEKKTFEYASRILGYQGTLKDWRILLYRIGMGRV